MKIALCTHITSLSAVIPLLKKIGKSKVLPDNLLPFLRHAIKLLDTHGDDLLVRPAEGDAQERMTRVRRLLRSIAPMEGGASLLQTPLSEEVLRSVTHARMPAHARTHARARTHTYSHAHTRLRARTLCSFELFPSPHTPLPLPLPRSHSHSQTTCLCEQMAGRWCLLAQWKRRRF
jgi:hypothetical protein